MHSKAERKEATRQELARRKQLADPAPWFTWKDLPLVILLLPFALLLGFHISLLAMLIRRLTRIPYCIALPIIYALLILPLWASPVTRIVLAGGTIVVLLASLLPLVFDDRDGVLNGGNFEHSAPAHILLVLLYLLVPAVNAAMEAHDRLQEKQNKAMQTEPPTTPSVSEAYFGGPVIAAVTSSAVPSTHTL